MKNPWNNTEKALFNTALTDAEIAIKTHRTVRSVSTMRYNLKKAGALLPTGAKLPANDPIVEKAKQVPVEFGKIPVEVVADGKWTRFGLVTDTHLCSHHERLDALHSLYATFKREEISTVFHAGNIIDGYLPRINGGSVYESSVDGQAMYCAKNYPLQPGIVTHFITGDDHESWFGRDGFNVGSYIELVCQREGRSDLKYVGHVEADCELRCGEFSQIMKISHPGGGSAYARSYTGQKCVESYTGGEKPAILVNGHYHLSNYMFDRNVHVISLPGMQDQTIFARKKRLRMEVGGAILEFKMNPLTGCITRLRLEWFMFYDRGFYKPFLKSDPHMLQQKHIIIDA